MALPDPSTGKRPARTGAVAAVAIVVVLALLGGAGYWWWSRPASSSPSATTSSTSASPTPLDGVRTVDLAVDQATDIEVDTHWSIHVPQGGVASASVLTIRPVSMPSATPDGAVSLAAAGLELSTGQPAAPWTFTWRQEQSLDSDAVLYLIDDEGAGHAYVDPDGPAAATEVTPAHVRPAELAADRKSGSVTVSHLSFKQWLLDAASAITHAVGSFFDSRADAPTCDGPAPAWLSETIYLDDVNAPLRVCAGVDRARPELAVVKVANNRGGGMLVAAPVAPEWVWQSVIGDHIEDWPTNVMTQAVAQLAGQGADVTRTWFVPPGQQVHFGFSESALRASRNTNPAEITSRFSGLTIAVGMIMRLASTALDRKTSLWDFALIAGCLQGVGADLGNDHSAGGIAVAFTTLVRCVVEQPETIMTVMRKSLSPAAWAARSAELYRAANTVKKAAGRYLIIGEVAFAALDIAGTLSLPSSAFTVSLFLTVVRTAKATEVVNLAGMTASGDPADGFTVSSGPGQVDACSGSSAAAGADIVSCAPSAAGADVCWVKPDRVSLLCGGLPWERVLYPATSSKPVAVGAAYPDPWPWGLELANGQLCRLRNGGAWDGRADGLTGAYYCAGGPNVVLSERGVSVVDRSSPTWTVKFGPIGSNNPVFPPPETVAVVKAYFAVAP